MPHATRNSNDFPLCTFDVKGIKMAQEQGRGTLTTRRTSTTYNFVREPNSNEDDDEDNDDNDDNDDDGDDDDF
ncbi:hypothetical protein ACLKA7_013957 [Drosophila subpalustris]